MLRSTATQMKTSKHSDEAHSSSFDLKSAPQTKFAVPENENDWTADFLIGALLYSLFSSSKGEAISGLLPDGEHN